MMGLSYVVKIDKFSKPVKFLLSLIELMHLVTVRLPLKLLLREKGKRFLDRIGLQTGYQTYHKLIKTFNLNEYKVVMEVNGSSFLVKPFMLDVISIFDERYEKELFEKWFKPDIGWIVLDVGAYYGRHILYTLLKR